MGEGLQRTVVARRGRDDAVSSWWAVTVSSTRGDEVFALDLLERLIAQPSVLGNDEAIAVCLDLIQDALAPFAREIERPVHDGLPSLIMRFGHGPADRMLTLCGHVDVVPAEGDWAAPPFALTRDGERLIGRGVVDMKGGVAAAVAAIRALAISGNLDRCRLELAITGDEEVGSRRGVRALLASNAFQGRMTVCPEPTALDVYLGNRGVVDCEITIHGRGGHAGLVHALDSPIGPTLALCQAIEAMPFTARDERFTPPTPSVAIVRVDAGATLPVTNVVPDTATIVLDRRLLPGEQIDDAVAAIEAVVADAVRPPFHATVRVTKRWPPCETSPDALVSRAAVAAVRSTGRPGAFDMDLPANDTSWFVAHGIPAILLGPGDPLQAHATDEWLDAAQFRDAIAVYAALAVAVVEESSSRAVEERGVRVPG
jgi:acetylornithine deacetylase/succinyl-diaminopimelate desuccinylase-like protein